MSRIIGYLTVDQKGRTTIPQRVREQLGIADGTQLRIELTETGAFEIVPSVSIPQDQAWYHGAEGRAMFEEAEADFRAGCGTRTHGESETRRFLDSLKKLGAAKKPAKKSPKRAVKR
jgi:AbrB family looped-hinge helix DNA binding protein